MCGICGYITPRDDRTSIEHMQRALAHRGPDDCGTSLVGAGGRTVALGHRRLSVIDLSEAGHQPMSDPAGEATIVYNGEVYNFPQLKADLERRGRRFHSRTDAEVVLQAYLEWGSACVEAFNGMFAFCIYDHRTDKLLLARDRTGIKPLYYYHRAGELAFASELKALHAYAGFSKEVDVEAIHEYLTFQCVPAPRSIFRDTYKLEPGCLLWFEPASGRVTLTRYWDALDSRKALAPAEGATEEQLVDEFDRRLTDAVGRHLISDVPVGTFLSGGVDSSLVTAAMTRILNRSVMSFTIGFEEANYDESVQARAIAAHLGTEHREHRLKAQDLLEIVPLLPDWHDEPFASPSALPTYFLSQWARGAITVALSGDGGDELMGGYSTYRRAAFLGEAERLPPVLHRGLLALSRSLPALTPESITPGLPLGDALEAFLYLRARYKPHDLELLLGRRSDFSRTRFETAFRASAGRSAMTRLMLVDFATTLPDLMFTKVDRASMAHALEVRVPLMDNEVVEFALGLPLACKIRGRKLKYLSQKLLARYLPRHLFERPKRGFGFPLTAWLRGELRYLVERYLDPVRIRRRGLFNPAFLQSVVQGHMSGRYNYQHMLWTVIVLELWFERWMDHGGLLAVDPLPVRSMIASRVTGSLPSPA